MNIAVKTRKKLIEVALPLDVINAASVRESYIYRGNPSALHKWWAQRPLAAARAVVFAQMVDDPSAHPDLFPTSKSQDKERERLFAIIEELVTWENTSNESVLERARREIWQSWRSTCADGVSNPETARLYDRFVLPNFCDPFAGGGVLPLEAQRLGLKSFARDLNPVAVLLNKAILDFPQRFASREPVNSKWKATAEQEKMMRRWEGVQGLSEDVLHYGQWIFDRAQERIGHLYPEVQITQELIVTRPDLRPLLGQRVKSIAYLWARTVKSPNPAFSTIDVPLASTFMLSTKPGKESYIVPLVKGDGYDLDLRVGKPTDPDAAKRGTKSGTSGSSFRCVMSGVTIPFDYIRDAAKKGEMGARMLAVVVESTLGRLYLPASGEAEALAVDCNDRGTPDSELPEKALGFRIQEYGMTKWSDLYTKRQLVSLTTLSDLVSEAREQILRDCSDLDLDKGTRLDDGGDGAIAYADAVATLLAFSLDKTAEYNCTIVPWYSKEDRPKGLFARQAIPMVWDYAEVNPLSDIGGSFIASTKIVAGALFGCYAKGAAPDVTQLSATTSEIPAYSVVSTDPPYYDNIGYADLSDFSMYGSGDP